MKLNAHDFAVLYDALSGLTRAYWISGHGHVVKTSFNSVEYKDVLKKIDDQLTEKEFTVNIQDKS